MALNPIISAEEKAIRQKELAEEKLLVTFLGDALEKAEEGLRIEGSSGESPERMLQFKRRF